MTTETRQISNDGGAKIRRIIFTLLYDDGYFMLSRNFRLQRAGDVDWLMRNFDFPSVSRGLDELMILDVTRGPKNRERFTSTVQRIVQKCFIPLTLGGGIDEVSVAEEYLRCGADKLLLNSSYFNDAELCRKLAERFGQQCLIAGIDYGRQPDGVLQAFSDHGSQPRGPLEGWVSHVQNNGAGEVLLQSIDHDGTGMGLDLDMLSELHVQFQTPFIFMGGVGRSEHIIDGFSKAAVNAIATANLFNFIGDSFLRVRQSLSDAAVSIALWHQEDYAVLKDALLANDGSALDNLPVRK